MLKIRKYKEKNSGIKRGKPGKHDDTQTQYYQQKNNPNLL